MRSWIGHAGLVLALEWITSRWVVACATRTRTEAAAVGLATGFCLLSGFILGVRNRRILNPSGAVGIAAVGLGAARVNSPFRSFPVGMALWPAATLAMGSLVWSTLDLDSTGPLLKTMLKVNATFLPAALCFFVGGLGGVNSLGFSLPVGFLGSVLVFVAGLGGFQMARGVAASERGVVALACLALLFGTAAVGTLMASLLRRVSFVEITIASISLAYGGLLALALGPTAWLGSSSIPEEQLFLAAWILPLVVIEAFLLVGSSLGFQFLSSGRLDFGFGFEFRTAVRYLRAQQRERVVGVVTVIAVLGVTLGVMALIVVLSVMSGFEADLRRKIIGTHAHIVVSKQGPSFSDYPSVERAIQGLSWVRSVEPFVLGDAMVSTDAGLSGTLVKGILPGNSDEASDLAKTVEAGKLRYLEHPEEIPSIAFPRTLSFASPPSRTSSETDGRAASRKIGVEDFAVPTLRLEGARTVDRNLAGIILGREMARSLRAHVGDVVKLVSPISDEIGPLGPTPKLRRFRVAGIFYSGMYEYDAKFSYIYLPRAQRFFGLNDGITGLAIKLRDVDQTDSVKRDMDAVLGGAPYVLQDWREMNKELFSALLLEKIAMFVALTMIVLVASFLIVATLMMIVLQRGKEVALLKAIGASDASIMKIFVLQGLAIGLLGATAGVMGGVGLCGLIARFGVELDESIFYIKNLPVVMSGWEVLSIALAAVLLSYLATLYPAMTAAKLPPVDGLRDEQ
jgi:ABC-type lipoprotein release transport system permease subunit